MTWIFWIALASVAYGYIGFPLLLWLRAKILPRPVAAEAGHSGGDGS